MSRDSNYTYVHTHASNHADLFEEFCHPPSSTSETTQPIDKTDNNNTTTQSATNNASSDPGMIQIPGHFLPFEEIQLPPHLMPLNPEDEDDVVPDMHAAFGIQRALGHGAAGAPGASGEAGTRGAQQEPVWRDLGMERLLEGGGLSGDHAESLAARVVGRREGKKTGILLMR